MSDDPTRDDRGADADPTDTSHGDGSDGVSDTTDTSHGDEPESDGDSDAGVSRGSRRETPSRPDPEPSATTGDAGPITRFRNSEHPAVVFLRETLSSALIVATIGLVLFGISGVWPPMVAVESGSMKPNMQKGDLIFLTEPGRFPASFADDNGIVTTAVGRENGHVQFGKPGSVIVYRPPGRVGPPIIHRARLHVEKGENWIDRADPAALPAQSCEAVPNCPAPHAGYLTKGDNNEMYDQVNSIRAPPVKPGWISGVARVRIPLLGWIRLIFSGAATNTPVEPVSDTVAAKSGSGIVGHSVTATGGGPPVDSTAPVALTAA